MSPDKIEYCIYCENEAIGFYTNRIRRTYPICSSCMEVMEVGNAYGLEGFEIGFELFDDESDEQEASNES